MRKVITEQATTQIKERVENLNIPAEVVEFTVKHYADALGIYWMDLDQIEYVAGMLGDKYPMGYRAD